MFEKLISTLMASRDQAHVFHWQTTGDGSFAAHMALNAYYDAIPDLTDALVESYQGKYGIVKCYKNYPLVEYKGNESTVSFFHNVCDKVTKLRDCCKDSWLQNEIDNVCTLLNQTIYKLKYLK